jgi:creatinine amidohydrolase
MTLPKAIWEQMTWRDVAGSDTSHWIAVVPVAAIEQHGPHLPLSTDLTIMEGYLTQIRAALPEDLPATFLPVQAVGLSPEHQAFPGTLTLTPETALRVWTEIGDSLVRAGVRKIVFVSSHGGNNGLLDIVTRDLRLRHSVLAVTSAFARFGTPPSLFPPAEIAHGVHAGAIETSLMLAFRPDLVDGNELADFPSLSAELENDFQHLRTGRPAGFGWMTQDLNPAGALGDARLATAEAGVALAEHGAQAFVQLLKDVHAFALNRLAPGPQA